MHTDVILADSTGGLKTVSSPRDRRGERYGPDGGQRAWQAQLAPCDLSYLTKLLVMRLPGLDSAEPRVQLRESRIDGRKAPVQMRLQSREEPT